MNFSLLVGMQQFVFVTFHAWIVEDELAVVILAKSVVLPYFVWVGTRFYWRLENMVRNTVLQVNYASVGLETMADCGSVVFLNFLDLQFVLVPFAFGVHIVAFNPKFNEILL